MRRDKETNNFRLGSFLSASLSRKFLDNKGNARLFVRVHPKVARSWNDVNLAIGKYSSEEHTLIMRHKRKRERKRGLAYSKQHCAK